MGYIFVDASDVGDKVRNVRNKVSDAYKTGATAANGAGVVSAAVFNGIGSSIRSNVNSANAQCARAEALMEVLNNAGEWYSTCEEDLKTTFHGFDISTVSKENELRDILGLDRINTVDRQKATNAIKIAVGVACAAVGVTFVALSSAALAPFVVGAVVSTGISVAFAAYKAKKDHTDVMDAISDAVLASGIGIMMGGIGKYFTSAKTVTVMTKTGRAVQENFKMGAVDKFLIKGGLDSIGGTIGFMFDAASGKKVKYGDVYKAVGNSYTSAAVGEIGDKINADNKVGKKSSVIFKKLTNNSISNETSEKLGKTFYEVTYGIVTDPMANICDTATGNYSLTDYAKNAAKTVSKDGVVNYFLGVDDK